MNENNLIETARQKAKDGDLQTAKAILEELSSERARNLLNKVNSAIASEKQKALASRTNAPKEKPKNASLSSQIAEGIKQAKAEEKQAKAKQQGMGCLVLLAICGACWLFYLFTMPQQPLESVQSAQSDDAALIEAAIELVTDIDISSAQIVDRAGGGRTIILGYSSYASNEAELLVEYGSIFGAVGGAIQEFGIEADELGIVVGNRNGMAIESVAVQTSDILDFLNGEISGETFFGRITRVDF